MIAVLLGACLALAAVIFVALYFSTRRVNDRRFRKGMRAGGADCARTQDEDMVRLLERHYGAAEPDNEIARQLAKRRQGARRS